MKFSKELKIAIKAAKEAGKILNKYFKKNIVIERKSDKSPVTIADKEAEKKIVSIIRKHFPDHNFLCEEFSYEKTDSEFKWIIDPLDGTKNFVRGLKDFGTLIGLEKNGKIVIGVVNLPAINLMAYAAKGKGTFLKGKKVKVACTKQLSESYIEIGDINRMKRKHRDKQLLDLVSRCERHFLSGGPAFYVKIAEGLIDIYVEDGIKPWDIAAGKIIVEEAGGKLTDFEGRDTIYSGNAIATNGILHDGVVKMFRKR